VIGWAIAVGECLCRRWPSLLRSCSAIGARDASTGPLAQRAGPIGSFSLELVIELVIEWVGPHRSRWLVANGPSVLGLVISLTHLQWVLIDRGDARSRCSRPRDGDPASKDAFARVEVGIGWLGIDRVAMALWWNAALGADLRSGPRPTSRVAGLVDAENSHRQITTLQAHRLPHCLRRLRLCSTMRTAGAAWTPGPQRADISAEHRSSTSVADNTPDDPAGLVLVLAFTPSI